MAERPNPPIKLSEGCLAQSRRIGFSLVVSWALLAAKNGQSVSCMALENRTDPIAFARDMERLPRPLRLKGRYWVPKDGLYRVATRRKVHGGFLVCHGRVTRASPYVRRYIHILAMRNAVFVGDLESLL
jgi:hypothetical protein